MPPGSPEGRHPNPLRIPQENRHGCMQEIHPGSIPDSLGREGQTYAMVVSYDGSRFHGWQIQDNALSVEQTLSQALSVITRFPAKVIGSGRTDAGVHALNQTAHFVLPHPFDPARLTLSLNGLAKPFISVKQIIPVSDRFHARHSALGKSYRYCLYIRPYPPVFGAQRSWWLHQPLDVAAMREGGAFLLGTHDFSAFRAASCSAKTPIRHLRAIHIQEEQRPESTLTITLEGSGFLQYMARNITGTLVAVGQGKMPPQGVARILEGRQRNRAPATAPARGLHLARVYYDLKVFPELNAFEPLYDSPVVPDEPWPPKHFLRPLHNCQKLPF